jgi:hypothetical protein
LSYFLFALGLAACFGQPQDVVIEGYRDHAMEPFIARDGETLFFNNRNEPARETDLHWATRVNDLRFRYRGRIPNANSGALDGVPSLARDGTFAFTSLRAFETRGATIWTGRWDGDSLSRLNLEMALRPGPPPHFNMDGELAAGGDRFYVSDNRWALIGGLRTSDLRVAVRENGHWRRAPEFDRWFAAINTDSALEYAPATSEDERELYFTRLTRPFLRPPRFETFVAQRADAHAPFGAPERIAAITGYAEAPTVAPDGALYFHAMADGRFTIRRAPRACS